MSVEGGIVAGYSENDIPFVQGNDNIIKINIDNPIDIDLSTFANNVMPYLTGDNNMVTIEITGADNYITSATVLGHTLTLVKRSPTGTFTQDLILPYSHDGDLKQMIYNSATNTITNTYVNVVGLDNAPFESRESTPVIFNTIKDNAGNIISISLDDSKD